MTCKALLKWALVAGTVICVGPGKKEKDDKGKETGEAKKVSVQPGTKVGAGPSTAHVSQRH